MNEFKRFYNWQSSILCLVYIRYPMQMTDLWPSNNREAAVSYLWDEWMAQLMHANDFDSR